MLRLGKLNKEYNLDSAKAANKFYHAILISDGGNLETLLLTDKELLRARERADKNPEDCVRPTPMDRWLR